jgi:hypothetical protein
MRERGFLEAGEAAVCGDFGLSPETDLDVRLLV